MASSMRVLVTGAGGFIGHHLIRRLKQSGVWVRGADVRHPDYEPSPADDFQLVDLREWEGCLQATRGVDQVYNLAADMGGIGYITAVHARLARDNVLINAHMLEAARVNRVSRFLFSSSACVYAQAKQTEAEVTPLKEEDAHPADPEPGYGWEKLYTEELCRYFYQDHRLETRVARLHNLYGPLGCYDGGREKSVAAICRKVALARDGDEIEIWGDGEQTRSYLYIDDCLDGLTLLMASDYRGPLNLGTERLVTIDHLVDLVSCAAAKRVTRRYDPAKPQGVRGRSSDNTRVRRTLGWDPKISLEEGLARTYAWIAQELRRSGKLSA
ncbi:MAG: NAD-dependent epimerase/dehydratase family protein [Candidatus Riflebacteria bacterium]|nr:NAD-dependent epimerase/dehydratase family protein [Candidatus Riflebacteria bacterium]